MQRDVPGGVAHPTATTVFPSGFHPWQTANMSAWEALRTDVAGGDAALYFDLDDAFVAPAGGQVLVLVTGCESAGATWWLDYRTPAGAQRRTPTWSDGTTGAWRTVGFLITDAAFANQFAGGTDFRLTSDGAGDLAVSFVRVVRLAAPAGAGVAPASPLLPTVTAAPGATVVSGTAPAGATVLVTVGGVVVATPIAGADGAWSATIPAVRAGRPISVILVTGTGASSPPSAAIPAPTFSAVEPDGCGIGGGLAAIGLLGALHAWRGRR